MVTDGMEDIVVDSILRYSRQLYICCFSLLGPKGGGYGGMVDAADSIRLSLGMETY